jgi:hypothetical protein
MFQYPRIRSVLIATLFLVPILAQAAQADDTATQALAEASKLIEKGVPVKAIELINNTLKSGKVPGDLAAKALLMRAQAQETIGKHAYALADYNSALWMQGLSDRDKKEAEDGRRRIMAKLGVTDGDKAAVADAGKSGRADRPATAPARTAQAASSSKSADKTSWDTEVQASGSEQRTGGIGSFFSGLFGSSESKAATAESEPEPKSAAVVTETAAPRPSQKAQIQPPQKARLQPVKAEPVRKAAVQQAAPEPAPAASEPQGNFAIQFAALQAEDSAISEVNRVTRRFGELLGGRKPSVTIAPTKDGGTLYKVIAEPYDRGEGTATCELLKSKGLSCMLISR